MNGDNISPFKIVAGISIALITVIVFFTGMSFFGKLWVSVDQQEIVICQDPYDGELHVITSPGTFFMHFSDCTFLRKSFQVWFDPTEDASTQAFPIRFKDGAIAPLSGTIRADLPLDKEHILKLYTTYGTQQAIDRELVRVVMQKVIKQSGPLVSSRDSFAAKRNNLIYWIEDQAENGIYVTREIESLVTDRLTGKETIEIGNEIVKLEDGTEKREDSILEEFGVRAHNFALKSIAYEDHVLEQIKAQQTAVMGVETAIAEALKATQDAITAEQTAKAKMAEARAEASIAKEEAVVEGEKKRDVAALDLEAAVLEKKALIARGQGEAEARRLKMIADGALEQILSALIQMNSDKYKHMASYAGNWVPYVVNGEGSGGGMGSELSTLTGLKLMEAMGINIGFTKRK